MSVEGTWDLTISTPIGKVLAAVHLQSDSGALTGTASSAGEDVPLRDVTVQGNHLTWTQSITKPIRLNLNFSVDVDGDTIVGTSKAGRLPASKVAGRRRAV
jgi:hypothetical protein